MVIREHTSALNQNEDDEGVFGELLTERRCDELLERSQSSVEIEEWLRFALTSAGMIAWELELETGATICSGGAMELLGLQNREFTEFSDLIHPADRAIRSIAIVHAIRDQLPYDLEYRLVLPGGVIWVADRARFKMDSDGHPTHLVGVCADISARKQTEERLKDNDRRKNEFMAFLGHELRNPLAPISSAIQIMTLREDNDPTLQRVTDVLGRQVQQLTRLVDDLLDYSRITHGKIQLKKEAIVISDVVARAIETCQPLIDRCRHHLSVMLPSEPIGLHADCTSLTQVLVNLLNNAAKYTPPGGNLSIVVEQHQQQAILRVRDTGAGIAANMLPRIFDMFQQVDRSLPDCQGGLGIGLTLVRRLVELHGGTVEARSNGLGHGSEFVVHLPCSPSPQVN